MSDARLNELVSQCEAARRALEPAIIENDRVLNGIKQDHATLTQLANKVAQYQRENRSIWDTLTGRLCSLSPTLNSTVSQVCGAVRIPDARSKLDRLVDQALFGVRSYSADLPSPILDIHRDSTAHVRTVENTIGPQLAETLCGFTRLNSGAVLSVIACRETATAVAGFLQRIQRELTRRKNAEERQRKATERSQKTELRKALESEKAAKREAIRKAKENDLRAAAASYFGRTRQMAAAARRKLRHQLERFPRCPYCGAEIGAQPILDHIYPVTRGGQSTDDNLVWVCEPCNQAKSSQTLYEFARIKGLNLEYIEAALRHLGKRF